MKYLLMIILIVGCNYTPKEYTQEEQEIRERMQMIREKRKAEGRAMRDYYKQWN